RKSVVDEALKGLRGVSKTKRRSGVFEKTEWGDYSCFWDVFRCNWDLIKGFYQIDFAEDDAAVKLGVEFKQVRDRISVRDRSRVECTIVANHAPGTIRLLHHVKRR